VKRDLNIQSYPVKQELWVQMTRLVWNNEM